MTKYNVYTIKYIVSKNDIKFKLYCFKNKIIIIIVI